MFTTSVGLTPVGIATDPALADPHTAGEAELAQLVELRIFCAFSDPPEPAAVPRFTSSTPAAERSIPVSAVPEAADVDENV